MDFLLSGTTETFTGGEAGGGKSWALCHDFLRDQHHSDANAILFRRTYPDLEDLIHKALEHFEGLQPTFNTSKHLFTFPSGARFRFSHLQHIKDIYTHSGQEYSHIYWDELPQFPELPYLFMMSRLRSTNKEIVKRIKSTGNPDGEGVLWVKHRFVDKLEPHEVGWFKTVNNRDTKMEEGTPGAISRSWLPTVRSQNKILMDADPDYESMLDQLPEDKKQALKFGSWDTFDKDDQLILSDWWDEAVSGNVKAKDGIRAIGADYAVSGDRCALCDGIGNSVKRFKAMPGMDTDEFGALIYKRVAQLGKFRTVSGIDSIGPGVGVYHYLRKTDIKGFLVPCQYKDKSFGKDQFSYKMHFDNWRSQAWWKFKEDMEKGKIDLSPLTRKEGYFDELYKLQEEVLAHTADQINNKFVVISKKSLKTSDFLGRSPDLADALVIWNWVRERQLPSRLSKFQVGPDIDYEPVETIGNNPYTSDDGTDVAWT